MILDIVTEAKTSPPQIVRGQIFPFFSQEQAKTEGVRNASAAVLQMSTSVLTSYAVSVTGMHV